MHRFVNRENGQKSQEASEQLCITLNLRFGLEAGGEGQFGNLTLMNSKFQPINSNVPIVAIRDRVKRSRGLRERCIANNAARHVPWFSLIMRRELLQYFHSSWLRFITLRGINRGI